MNLKDYYSKSRVATTINCIFLYPQVVYIVRELLKVSFGVTLAYSAVLTDLVSSAGPEQLKKNLEILQVAV